MIERLFHFLPSLVTLSIITGICVIYFKVVLPMTFGKKNFKNIEWGKRWIKEHRWKATLLVGTPVAIIAGPAMEELVFRGPLVVLFGQISGYAWLAIILSNIVFASLHYFGDFSEKLFESVKLLHQDKYDDSESEEPKKEVAVKVIKITRGISSLLVGILLGYLGIKYQSLWLCAAIHAGWNLLMPFILPFLAILIGLGFLGISMLIGEIKWRFFYR